jgi:hypothetical protein
MYDFFMSCGYKIFRIIPDGIREVYYKPEFEIFRMANFVAIKI